MGITNEPEVPLHIMNIQELKTYRENVGNQENQFAIQEKYMSLKLASNYYLGNNKNLG